MVTQKHVESSVKNSYFVGWLTGVLTTTAVACTALIAYSALTKQGD